MDINVKMTTEWSTKGVGPYLVVTVTLKHSEVPTADKANQFAEKVVDAILRYYPEANAIKTALTLIYGKLTPTIGGKDVGNGVIVITRVPTGGIGVPYSDVRARPVSTKQKTLMTTCISKLFWIYDNDLQRIDPGSGRTEAQGPVDDWPEPRCMTTTNSKLFVIDAGQGGTLWRVNPRTMINDGIGPAEDWPKPLCMTAIRNKIFVIDGGEGGRLWRVDPTTLLSDAAGPANDWPNPLCMTASGTRLYVIDGGEGGRLWRVNPTTLVNDGAGPVGDWPKPLCMTATGNMLYVIDGGEGGRLWRVNPRTLVSEGVGPINDWPKPLCMTAIASKLFVIDASEGRNRLWSVDTGSLAAHALT